VENEILTTVNIRIIAVLETQIGPIPERVSAPMTNTNAEKLH